MGRKTKPIITIDCETDPFMYGRSPMPFLWGLYDGERYHRFDDAPSMIAYLAEIDCIVYAHNGGKFDYQFILDLLEPFTEITIINGRIARFKIGNAEFRDSWNILPVRLATFGKDEIDFHKLERAVRHKHMAEIERYNAKDCRSLWEAVTAFTKNYGTALTLAGAAMTFWNKKLKNDKPQSSASFYNQVSPWYHGGRVECFFKGVINAPFHVVDINSAYPYAMMHKHPISVHAEPVTPKEGAAVIPQSMYTVEGVSRGALPYHDDRGALIFPNDNEAREFQCTGWELQAAMDTGRLGPHVIRKRLDFLKEIDFVDYVQHFYRLKASVPKEDPQYTFAKLMMNSLYGKFGANPDRYRSYGIVPLDSVTAAEADPALQLGRNYGPWTWAGTLGGHGLMVGKDPVTGEANAVDSPYYCVATAASITGFVRAYLLRHMDKITRVKGGKVLYCDTDSVVYQHPSDDITKHPFKLSKELGDWGYEGRFIRGGIAGKKMYAFESQDGKYKKATKGVKLQAVDIMRIAEGEEITWQSEAPSFSVHAKQKEKGKPIETRFLHRKVRMT